MSTINALNSGLDADEDGDYDDDREVVECKSADNDASDTIPPATSLSGDSWAYYTSQAYGSRRDIEAYVNNAPLSDIIANTDSLLVLLTREFCGRLVANAIAIRYIHSVVHDRLSRLALNSYLFFNCFYTESTKVGDTRDSTVQSYRDSIFSVEKFLRSQHNTYSSGLPCPANCAPVKDAYNQACCKYARYNVEGNSVDLEYSSNGLTPEILKREYSDRAGVSFSGFLLYLFDYQTILSIAGDFAYDVFIDSYNKYLLSHILSNFKFTVPEIESIYRDILFIIYREEIERY